MYILTGLRFTTSAGARAAGKGGRAAGIGATATLWRWMFWINGGLHVLFLIAALVAVFRP